MDYQARTQLWIKYLHEQGVRDGRYLAEVPYKQLTISQRRHIWHEAQKQARSGLIPTRTCEQDECYWILGER